MRLPRISDIHANMEALHAIRENVKYDRIYRMGDLVGYGTDPLECINRIRDNVPTIMGNHDNAVALRPDCGCDYVHKHMSEATREYTWAHISDKEEDFLCRLPLKRELDIDGIKFIFAHGSPASFFDYIDPDTPMEKLVEFTSGVNADYLIVGHTHEPDISRTSKLTIFSPWEYQTA